MIALLATIGTALLRMLPWILKAAPWIISILSFTSVGQQWLAAGASRLASVVFPVIGLPDFPVIAGDFLRGMNYFIPVDTIFFVIAAYIPFYIACLNHRLMKSFVISK